MTLTAQKQKEIQIVSGALLEVFRLAVVSEIIRRNYFITESSMYRIRSKDLSNIVIIEPSMFYISVMKLKKKTNSGSYLNTGAKGCHVCFKMYYKPYRQVMSCLYKKHINMKPAFLKTDTNKDMASYGYGSKFNPRRRVFANLDNAIDAAINIYGLLKVKQPVYVWKTRYGDNNESREYTIRYENEIFRNSPYIKFVVNSETMKKMEAA